jgi:hypothetical protein
MLGLQIFLADWDIELFAIDWLKRGILVERETSVLTSSAEAIAAAKLRARDVARRHPGQEPDTFRLMDATGKILGVFPKNPNG